MTTGASARTQRIALPTSRRSGGRGSKPWIDPNGAEPDEIVSIIRRCPSGALSYAENDRIEDIYSDKPEIQVARNGPYHVRGGVSLDAEQGDGASWEHYALCRCGASTNKPFCDGNHWYAAFKDDEALTISKANRTAGEAKLEWIALGRVADIEPDHVHSGSVGEKTIALVRTEDGWRALDGRCPHQGGPLTEGTLCEGKIRCPWHGYDFDLATGKGAGNDLTVETLKVREQEGFVEIEAPQAKRSAWTVSHVVAETMLNWGVDTVFGMVGHSNLGLAEAFRVQEARRRLRYFGVRPRRGGGIRLLRIRQGNRTARCVPGHRRARSDQPVDGPLGCEGGSRAGVGADRPGEHAGHGGRERSRRIDLASAFAAVTRFSQTMLPESNHAELTSLALKTATIERDVGHLIFPGIVYLTQGVPCAIIGSCFTSRTTRQSSGRVRA